MTVSEYNSCVDRLSDGVFRFILKNVRDRDTAGDIVQDTFEKLWRHVSEVDAAKAKSWLFTTAYRTMIDFIRRERFSASPETADEYRQETYNTFSDLKAVLNDALAKLSEVQRSVILLRNYEGYSYEEIGEITGLNPSQVKVYIYRARVILKSYIGSLDKVI